MKTIIIIPYRDRVSHLSYWLKNTYPLLKNVIEDLEVIVVEQVHGKAFNRGATINIGYAYYNNPEYNYITQDVDVNPIQEDIVKQYAVVVEDNIILAIYSDGNTLGGIIKMRGSTLKKINGFPNDYWGWGHEDKDILNRANFYNCKIVRNIRFADVDKHRKLKIFEDNHNRQENNKYSFAYKQWARLNNNAKKTYIENNGLTTLHYKVLSEEKLMDGVKKIVVIPNTIDM